MARYLHERMGSGIRRAAIIAGVSIFAVVWLILVTALVKFAWTYLTTGTVW